MNKIRWTKIGRVAVVGLAVLATAGSAGCRHRQATDGIEGDAAAVATPDGSYTVSKYVVVNNPQLAKGIQIVDLKTSFTDNNLMLANVTLVSKSRRTLAFQYRFAWFDEQGIEIDPEASAWKPMTIYGHESRTLQGTAPNSAAKEFRVKLRKL